MHKEGVRETVCGHRSCVFLLHQVFFCGATAKASELLNEGAAEAADFSLVVGASTWNVSIPLSHC